MSNLLTQSQIEDTVEFLKRSPNPSMRATNILLALSQILRRESLLGNPEPWSHVSVQTYVTAAVMVDTGHMEDAFAEAEILRLHAAI